MEDKKEQTQVFHDRAREAGTELLKLKITLSTGIIGVMVIVVTTNITPALKLVELISVLFSLAFFGLSVIFGLITWYTDARRYYYWANSIQDKKNKIFTKKKMLYNKQRYISNIIGTLLFIFGILSTITYILLRVINNYQCYK
jgi:hypothetical protein